MSESDSHELTKYLHMISDLERISDHAVGVLASVEEMRAKGIHFSDSATRELDGMVRALLETLDLAVGAYEDNDLDKALRVEPLKQIVDALKTELRSRHIRRMQKGVCTIEAGFVWSDLLTNLGRVADHCANIAGCVMEMSQSRLDLHDYSKALREGNRDYSQIYDQYAEKYLQPLG